jgi:hypothetical protein
MGVVVKTSQIPLQICNLRGILGDRIIPLDIYL